MIRVTSLAGLASDPALAGRLHELEHRGGIEKVRLSRTDMARRRQQLRSDRGTELALLLDRDARLQDGAVLLLEADRAIVLELQAQPWLVLRALDTARALELGHFAGSMHWKVRFDGDRLCIALNGSRDDALKRLAHLLARGGVDVEPASALPSDGACSDEELGHGHGHEHGHAHQHPHQHGHGHAHRHGHEPDHPNTHSHVPGPAARSHAHGAAHGHG